MKAQRAFTLINLLVVFALMTVLSAILFPRFVQPNLGGNASATQMSDAIPGTSAPATTAGM